LTLAAIYTSHWLLGNAPGQAVPGIVVVSIALVPAVFLVLWTAVRPRYGLLALTALLISSAVLLAATWLAVWIPLQEMIDSLQAAP
jgi:multisubunit Na+/H+ antiporter MnhB subunit